MEIVTPDENTSVAAGRHNASLAESTTRIIEGGTWKKQRVVYLMPADKLMPTRAALSHMNLAFPPNQSVYRMAVIGDEVGIAYQSALDQILGHPELSQWEFVLTVEADNVPPFDGVLRLIRRMEAHPEMACIGGLYWTKGEAGVPQIWGDIRDPLVNYRPQAPVPGEIVECYGTGMGFNLWRVSMFRELAAKGVERPWFKTAQGLEGEGVGTQDLRAWGIFRRHGYRCGVDCDVLVGHLDVGTGIVW